MVLSRVWPVRRGRPVTLSLPPIKAAVDVVAAALGAVADAMTAGELTPEEASAVAGVLEAHRRAIETADLDERLRRLEQALGTAPSKASLDRRLRKLETVAPTDDPRRYLGRPIDEWPDAALERVARHE
jgi:hypothetical protein